MIATGKCETTGDHAQPSAAFSMAMSGASSQTNGSSGTTGANHETAPKGSPYAQATTSTPRTSADAARTGDKSVARSPSDQQQKTATDAVSPAAALGSQAIEVASHVASQAKELVATRVGLQTEKSAMEFGDVANALRETSKSLQGNPAAPYLDKAADQVERVSRFLKTATAAEAVREVEVFARRDPLLFLGGAFTLGLLGARFIKSTSRHGTEHGGYPAQQAAGATPQSGHMATFGKDRR
jgi:hypothetical protein